MEGFTWFVLIVLRTGGTENGAEEQGCGQAARPAGETEAAAYRATLAKAQYRLAGLARLVLDSL